MTKIGLAGYQEFQRWLILEVKDSDRSLVEVHADVGVCLDVIVRAYRGIDIDLQQLVHEDMKKTFLFIQLR